MQRILIQIFVGLMLGTPCLVAQNLNWKEKRSCKRIKSNIAYLASDALEGRSTGSEGEQKSAEFIAAEFERYGLQPQGEEGYFQKFSITSLRIADSKSEVSMNNLPLQLFAQYYPLSYSSNQSTVSTGVVDVQFGISTDKRDDYAGKNVKDAIVLINISSPDGIHPHSEWMAWHGINLRVDEAVKRGAVGVMFYRANDKTAAAESDLSLSMKASSVPVIYLTDPVLDPSQVVFASINIRILTDQESGHNVIGYKDNGAAKTVVIGAHHDHLGRGEHGGSLATDEYQIHNGADDNASGVSAVIELARMFKKSKSWNRNYNYLFIAFSGEEMGLVGSKYFVEHPTIDLSSVNYMINMDMIGMLNKETKALIINGVGTGSLWKESIARLDPKKKGIGTVKTTVGGIGPSDHTSFYLKGIPAIHFFTGSHDHYHKPTDDVERLNYEGEVFVVRYIKNMVRDLNDYPAQEYIATTEADSSTRVGSRSSFNVTLGIVPNYTFDGEGLEVDAVRTGKPGDEAGLKAGDIIISFNQQSIANIGDYMKVLQALEAGAKSEVVVRRDGEVITLTVQF